MNNKKNEFLCRNHSWQWEFTQDEYKTSSWTVAKKNYKQVPQ